MDPFIASGKVLFTTAGTDARQLERQTAAHLEASLGYRVDTFVRTAGEVAAFGRSKMFPEQDRPGVTMHVCFWHEPLPREAARKFAAARTTGNEFRVRGREFYWLRCGRVSDSKVWSLPAIQALELPTSTLRNLTRIRKCVAQHRRPRVEAASSLRSALAKRGATVRRSRGVRDVGRCVRCLPRVLKPACNSNSTG